MDFEHRERSAQPVGAPASGLASAPGKRTLAEQLPIQRRADGSSGGDSAQVHEAAARGTATPTTRLPHGDRIQQLFGRHDISGIKAHTGSEAAGTARAMGARGYATGEHVVLGAGADLHTVAHEAAHVVQQRGGVHLKRGVGSVGDAYERHADAVADHVVRGDSAERLLDEHNPGAAPAGSGGTGAVQRDVWDPAQHGAEQALANQQNLRHDPGLPAGTNAVQIGAAQDPLHAAQTAGDERHIDDDMLQTLRTVLDSLPASHINGNAALTRIVLEHANGQVASSFGGNTLTLIVPFDAASWVYLNVTKWPLGDLATTLGTTNHTSGSMTRDIVGTGGNLNKLSLVPEKFVEWMIRHEVGHSVDAAIGWHASAHYRNIACGAWDIHTGNLLAMVDTILTAVGLPAGANRTHLDNAFNPHTGAGYDRMLAAAQNNNAARLTPGYRAAALATFETNVPGGTRMVDYAESAIQRGLASPYENGGGVRLNNRTYHRDPQQGDWVSYQSTKYDSRDSNYQFQSPGEWFAETYSRYFKPPTAQWGQRVNDAAARAWFLANLDPVNNPGGAALINALTGNLVPMPAGALGMPAAPVQNAAPPPGKVQNALSTLGSLGITVATLPVSAVTRTAGVAVGTAQLGKLGLQAAYRFISGLF